MRIPVIMPKLEMSQETAVIIEWLKQDGDFVKKGEPIMSVETDKLTVEIESLAEGVLCEISAREGEIVQVTTTVAYLFQPDKIPSQIDGSPITSMQIPTHLASTSDEVATKSKTLATPLAARIAAAEGVELANVTGNGPAGKIMKSDVVTMVEQKRRASPAARRVSREQNIPLSEIEGKGPLGRIQVSDVFEAISQASSPVAKMSLTSEEVIKLGGMRRTIAERMQTSYQTVPHINFTSRVDMTELEQLRKRMNENTGNQNKPHVSLTTLFVKIVAHTLRQHRWFNSSLRENEIHLFRDINIGVAIALSDGLIVPVLKNADQKGIEILAMELTDLIIRAGQNKLQPNDISSGTFTISNLGPFGIEQFNAIINPGQAAILAIGASQPEVIPIDGQPTIRPILRITLSADHRIVDGAMAAQFMKDLKSSLEYPFMTLW